MLKNKFNMENKSRKILGFQYEPVRRRTKNDGAKSDSSWESCYEEDSGDDNEIDRTDLGTKTWCKCGKCVSIPTTTECLCCHELESAHLFDLGIYIQYVLVSFNYIKVYLSSLVFCVVASGLIKDEDCLRCDECHIVFYR